MIKVLSIGNSFSQDAQRYLHQIAEHEQAELECTNLYVGGCSLQTHCENLMAGAQAYALEQNGQDTGKKVSIQEALDSDSWDYVTLQQVSQLSVDFSTYEPWLQALARFVRQRAPGAKLLMHQTWAYEQGCQRLNGELGFRDQQEMLEEARQAYRSAAKAIQADGIIPSGEAMMKALELGVKQVHRDTFHASLGLGRYILGLTWFRALTGRQIQNGHICLDVPAEEEELKIALQAVEETAAKR